MLEKNIINKDNEKKLPKKYIINKNRTILFWEDGTKTIVKRAPEDKYNKTLSFLWAYFQKTSGLSKTKANKYIQSLYDEEELKVLEFLKDGTINKALIDIAESLSESFKSLANSLK